MKCITCQQEIKEEWKYCPECGVKIEKNELELVTTERLQYLWERWDKGKFLDTNFQAFKNLGRFPYMHVGIIRTQLKDFSHINILNLQIFSFLFSNPKYSIEFYKIGKLLGFHSGATALKAAKVDQLVNILNKTGVSWKVFGNNKIRDVYVQGWEKIGPGKSKWIDIDKEKGLIHLVMYESSSTPIHSQKPSCGWLCGVHCGHMGLLFDGIWECVETKCVSVGDPHCEFELRLCEVEGNADVPLFSKEEVKGILDSLVSDVVGKDKIHRSDLGDFYHMGINQYMNYFLMALSEGHAVLSKHSGILVGKLISPKASLTELDATLNYVRDLFLYLKAGILHKLEHKGNQIIL